LGAVNMRLLLKFGYIFMERLINEALWRSTEPVALVLGTQ